MTKKRLDIIHELLSSDPLKDKKTSLNKWKKIYLKEAAKYSGTADKALLGGYLANNVAFAFAAGYNAALQRLVPKLPQNVIISFCVTEEGGAHPRMIKSKLAPATGKGNAKAGTKKWLLNGKKQFITCAAEADLFLIAASKGTDGKGKNRIQFVLLAKKTKGLSVQIMNDLPFVPEISHGIIQLENVKVKQSQFLKGDGYTKYIKPFRTIEDLHIHAAILGYLFRVAKIFNWPKDTSEQLLSLMVTTRALSACDPLGPEIHVATGGLLKETEQLITGLDPFWKKVHKGERKAWERDSVLLSIAKNARKRRLETAWSHYENFKRRK